jgi:hypothetical protein
MLAGPDGKPMVGPDGKMLGVRSPAEVSAGVRPDVSPDAAGNVRPGTGGMSVSPSLRELPDHRVPKRLRLQGVANARGPNELRVWAMGQGQFVGGRVSANLLLRIDPRDKTHGFVEPDIMMQLHEYRQALAATRDLWEVDEVV